jgi:hypothetical protein
MVSTAMDDDLAYFLDLRLRLRGRSEALAVVDRCIGIIARANGASAAELATLEGEVEALRRELVDRFGPRDALRLH